MEFGIIATLIGALVAGVLARAVWRPKSGSGADRAGVAVYRDQLSEIDRDLARGVISPQSAEQVRIEVSRRLLAADAEARAGASADEAGAPVLGVVLAVLVFGGAWVLYAQFGAPGLADMPLAARIEAAEQMRATRATQSEVETRLGGSTQDQPLVAQLRAALRARPDDLQGHILLARHEAGLGNFAASHAALARVIAIKGDAALAGDYADYADMLVLAADGYVSPEAEAAAMLALARDPNNGVARYYVALMYAQTGRADLAFAAWRALLDEGPTDAPWVAPIRAQIEFAAAEAGVRYELPEPLSAPSAQDVTDAQAMSALAQYEMITGMVERLAARLASQGGPVAEWARLITALGVLGEMDKAGLIWVEARHVFAADDAALLALKNAAEGAGLGE